MSKLLVLTLVALSAVANVYGHSKIDAATINGLAAVKKEGRFLEVPVIGLVLKSLKIIWFLLSTVCSVVDYKLAALALAVNTVTWALSFKLPIILGAAVIFGIFKLIGLSFASLGVVKTTPDPLSYAAEYLDLGTLKYGEIH